MIQINLPLQDARALFEVLRDLDMGLASLRSESSWGPDFPEQHITEFNSRLPSLLAQTAHAVGAKWDNTRKMYLLP